VTKAAAGDSNSTDCACASLPTARKCIYQQSLSAAMNSMQMTGASLHGTVGAPAHYRPSAVAEQVGADDFVVRNTPAPCQHNTTFTTYPHDLPPYTVSHSLKFSTVSVSGMMPGPCTPQSAAHPCSCAPPSGTSEAEGRFCNCMQRNASRASRCDSKACHVPSLTTKLPFTALSC
jgi:hypothetical protein